MSLTEIREIILELSPEERQAVQQLLDELNGNPSSEFDQHWGEVSKQRYENLKSGNSKGVPLEDVLKELELDEQ
jgi:Putative addiction module component